MKNRDYTLIVREVTPKFQDIVSRALSVIQDTAHALGFVSDMSYVGRPAPEPTEGWIVEYWPAASYKHAWLRSCNPYTRGVFHTEQEAKCAIQKNQEITGTSQTYRTRRIENSSVTAVKESPTDKPAVPENWIVEYKTSTNWHRSGNTDTSENFNSRENAEAAILKNYETGNAADGPYRAVRLVPEPRLKMPPVPRQVHARLDTI